MTVQVPAAAFQPKEPALDRDPLESLRRLEARRAPSILNDSSPLRWRYGERLSDVLEEACRRHADRIAVSTEGAEVTFAELDARANRMARDFIARGVKPGDRVAVLLDRGVEAYVALFALLKAGAAYVPLDASHPADRLGYIVSDSGASLVVAHLRLADKLGDNPVPTLVLETIRADVATYSDAPLSAREPRPPANSPTSSATSSTPRARPASRRASRSPIRASAISSASPPRPTVSPPATAIYQGMSVAFDFSIEEIWVPLAAGATLVPNTAATSLFGEELADFLEKRDVTCLACVPTLLASIDRDLPKLRILLIGGEACPPALVKRWSAPGRTLLNSYGPTETTVTATLGVMAPDRPVTIGRPLPTYTVVILDPEHDVVLDEGEQGEIGIAGIGVAEGYLNRPDLTQSEIHRGLPRRCRTIRRAASIAPATSAASMTTARSNISAASTRRSSCAAIASN